MNVKELLHHIRKATQLNTEHWCRKRGDSGGKCPHKKIVWEHCPHTLPNSSYKYIKYFYIYSYYLKFVNSFQQLSPISVETAFV